MSSSLRRGRRRCVGFGWEVRGKVNAMGHLGGEASIDLDASVDEVWAVVSDVETAPSWQDGLDSMNVLDRDADGRVARAESITDAKVKTIKSIVAFSYSEPTRVSWRQEKGDLKSVDGSWTLEDLGDGRTRATYKMEGDPGRMLSMAIRGPVEGRLRSILVENRPNELAARLGA
jgi:uncharacterized membrane protein